MSRSAPLALAEHAHSLVQTSPHAGRLAAERALLLARAEGDREAEVAALHALGFARYALGDARALGTIRAAVRVGERHGHPRRAALARRNLALYLTYAGKSAAGVREIEAACAALEGIDRACSEVFRIAVYGVTGRAPAGLGDSDRALRVLRRKGDRIWQARLLYNRGILLSEVGDLPAATRDLEAARQLYAELGAAAAVADAEIQLARSRLLAGEPLDCLALLDTVELETLSEWAACWLLLTRAEAHVALRLLEEARADLARFVEISSRARAVDSLRKARLDAARLALLADDAEAACALAASARRSFAGGRQPAHWRRAAILSVAANVARGTVRGSTLRTGLDAAALFGEEGYAAEELRARQLVAKAALGCGDLRLARREADAAARLRRGTINDRVGYWHVEALLRLTRGDPRSAERALRQGLRLLDDYRAAFGAAELRATASAIGIELAEAGLRIFVGTGDSGRVLAWAERMRANVLRLPRVRVAPDADLRAQQGELRRVAARVRDLQDRGRPARGLTSRQVELEASIRARTRRARGDGSRSVFSLHARSAARVLGARALVEYVELDGALHAVTMVGGRPALHDLGETRSAAQELEWLRFALGRLARLEAGTCPTAARASADAAGARLDRQLVEPLLPHLGDAPLVLVPTGALHTLPWAALPSLRGRPVVVAPSLSLWLDLTTAARPRRGKTALVAGPRLRHARIEVRDLSSLYPAATVLVGAAATATAVVDAFDGAWLAHVACHGRFRSDSPLFSSLELADGPLTALELERLRRPPAVLVLSACELALSDRHPGDELLGFSALLLAMGIRTLVASVVPVPDRSTRRVMRAFHRELVAGTSPAIALARAQTDPTEVAGFVCLGTG